MGGAKKKAWDWKSPGGYAAYTTSPPKNILFDLCGFLLELENVVLLAEHTGYLVLCGCHGRGVIACVWDEKPSHGHWSWPGTAFPVLLESCCFRNKAQSLEGILYILRIYILLFIKVFLHMRVRTCVLVTQRLIIDRSKDV